jgi:peptidylprolyl isomerase
MKHFLLSSTLLSLAVSAAAAQNATKPASPTTPASAPAHAAGVSSLPPGVPHVRGVVKAMFALRYQDIKIGTGAVAESNRVYKVLYTGYLAADGHKFDSSDDHRMPLRDKDGKPVMGDDGKPKLGDAQPISFPQGFGRVIPGFDQGFDGMRVGGKRRLFIPWQLAYGARGRPGPDPAHPGIPAKADLIFDVELVDVVEMQMPPNHPVANPVHPGMSLPQGHMHMNQPQEAKPEVPPAEKPAETTQPASQPTAPATSAPQQETKPATQSAEQPQSETKPQ